MTTRVETAATTLPEVLQTVLTHTLTQAGIPFQEAAQAAFHPGFPKPTHRIA
ncbi:hypothetical protein L0128_03285 [candidate division KSB1 bacterium]|nr:hypothetical protein [candidate division KSB1 bacterium]